MQTGSKPPKPITFCMTGASCRKALRGFPIYGCAVITLFSGFFSSFPSSVFFRFVNITTASSLHFCRRRFSQRDSSAFFASTRLHSRLPVERDRTALPGRQKSSVLCLVSLGGRCLTASRADRPAFLRPQSQKHRQEHGQPPPWRRQTVSRRRGPARTRPIR